ncbi:Protein transport protein Sec31A [Tetrabaena socialis]|uniref:Protein transport protein Sec31A n=1 Tax=Tetrabaena socialis TaxID=47790 RepID=A0A2J8A3S9_9CHLO|nr:Protein transport protein Sec31A [Tetrabaena socialis]|eukprot:PNH07174.1 Protein transport protein Sec31A [Tetrabaena socialis]
MPFVKQIDRSATAAFCPHAPFLAAGTVAGAIDISFSTSSVLELFSLDFASNAESLTPCGTVAAPERFNRLAWGQHIGSDQSFPRLGLLAGGLADGSVSLWDPTVLLDPLAKEQHRSPLLAKMQKHTGAVKGLEFNSFSPNLLASGAADSDLCIWDLAKPSTPSLYPALKASILQLACLEDTNGTTVVWDLKRQKPVISFRDPNSQRRASAIQWNPEIATQLIVASDDDRSPTLQMWDLRNSVSPLKEFVGHHKGVLGMAWSPHDSSLLLSSGKDNRTICWDVHSGDTVCELTGAHWNFDVQWSPTVPGIFATSSFDGKLGICNLLGCTGSKVTETVNADFTVTHSIVGDATPLRKAPAWMKRPVGATFGFGGRLVSFTHNRTQHTDPATGAVRMQDTAVLSVRQVVTEQELVARSEGFEAAIQGGNLQTLREYCGGKRSELSTATAEAAEAPEASQEPPPSHLFQVVPRSLAARLSLQRPLRTESVLSPLTGALPAPVQTGAVARLAVVGAGTLLAWDYELASYALDLLYDALMQELAAVHMSYGCAPYVVEGAFGLSGPLAKAGAGGGPGRGDDVFRGTGSGDFASSRSFRCLSSNLASSGAHAFAGPHRPASGPLPDLSDGGGGAWPANSPLHKRPRPFMGDALPRPSSTGVSSGEEDISLGPSRHHSHGFPTLSIPWGQEGHAARGDRRGGGAVSLMQSAPQGVACRARRLPLILDEVFSGLYRTGALTAAAALGITPDIAAYGKLLTGGAAPLAATLASREVFQAFSGPSKLFALLHGHSYTAYPVGCAAAAASLHLLSSPATNPNLCAPPPGRCARDPPCAAPCGRLRPLWEESAVTALSYHPLVRRVAAVGTVLAVELATRGAQGGGAGAAESGGVVGASGAGGTGGGGAAPGVSGYGSVGAAAVVRVLREAHGVYARPLGDVVYLLVPPTASRETAAWLAGCLGAALDALAPLGPSSAAPEHPLTPVLQAPAASFSFTAPFAASFTAPAPAAPSTPVTSKVKPAARSRSSSTSPHAAAGPRTTRGVASSVTATRSMRQKPSNIKKDPDGYKDEFMLQYRHYQALLEIFKLRPSKESREFGDLVLFMAQDCRL